MFYHYLIVTVQCHSNNDCPDDESCEGGSCSKVCSRVRCGAEAQCIARGHIATCECRAGARGNPWVACLRDECAADNDCATWLSCRTGVCRDPCPGACAQGALCSVLRHAPVCECPRGTQGNPKIECREGNFPYKRFVYISILFILCKRYFNNEIILISQYNTTTWNVKGMQTVVRNWRVCRAAAGTRVSLRHAARVPYVASPTPYLSAR